MVYGPSKSGANDIPLGPRRKLGTTTGVVGKDVHKSSSSSRHSDRHSHGDHNSSRSSRRSRSRSPDRRRSRFDMKPDKLAITHSSHHESHIPDLMNQVAVVDNKSLALITPAFTIAKSAPEPGKKRRSRWGGESEKAFVPGMPTMVPSNLTDDQIKQYLVQLEIEDCSRRLRIPDLGIGEIAVHDRSPSPEPVYDNRGKRLNTREYRTRGMLELKRHKAILEMQKICPTYKPPMDYKLPNQKLNERVFIPADEYPDINFVGLLIGPRGNTLKALEKDTGCRIIVRGKGSCKESKIMRPDYIPKEGADEPLHAFVTGVDPAGIEAGCQKVRDLIQEAIEAPENYLEMRKIQLRELAVLNGTLRPEDVLGTGKCDNCGEITHKTWECPNALNVTQTTICTACGGYGHIARDCVQPRPGYGTNAQPLDDEYSALMAELGEAPPPGSVGVAVPGLNAANPRFGQAQTVDGYGGTRSYDANNRYGGRGPPREEQQPIMRVNLAQQMGMSGGGYQHAPPSIAPWAPPPGGWSMPPGMPAASAGAGYSQGGYSYATGGVSAAPPPPPPLDMSSILSAPAPPPPEA